MRDRTHARRITLAAVAAIAVCTALWLALAGGQKSSDAAVSPRSMLKVQERQRIALAALELNQQQRLAQRISELSAHREQEGRDQQQRTLYKLARDQRKARAWDLFYQPSPECLRVPTADCGRLQMRARQDFERRYSN